MVKQQISQLACRNHRRTMLLQPIIQYLFDTPGRLAAPQLRQPHALAAMIQNIVDYGEALRLGMSDDSICILHDSDWPLGIFPQGVVLQAINHDIADEMDLLATSPFS